MVLHLKLFLNVENENDAIRIYIFVFCALNNLKFSQVIRMGITKSNQSEPIFR